MHCILLLVHIMERQNAIIVRLEPGSDLISVEGLFPGGQSTSWSHSVLKIPRKPSFWQCSSCPKSKHQASTNTCSTCSPSVLQPVRFCHCHKTESVGRSWESLKKPHYHVLVCQWSEQALCCCPRRTFISPVLLEFSLHIHMCCCNRFFPTDSCKLCLGLQQVVFLPPPPPGLLMQTLSSVDFHQHWLIPGWF